MIHGNTTVLFEGKPVGTPDAGTFWRIMAEHKVKSFFTAPTALRAIKREDPDGKLVRNYDLSNLKALYLAGERADPDTIEWAQRQLNVPVVDHWWQTETGYTIVGNPLGIEHLPVKLGSPTVPMPGYEVHILDNDGSRKAVGELGAIAIRLPLPPGTLPTLWNAEKRYIDSYLKTFKGYYETGDAGLIDEDGYVHILGRDKDLIISGGYNIYPKELEEIIDDQVGVLESAVIGVPHPDFGETPIAVIVSETETAPDLEIIESNLSKSLARYKHPRKLLWIDQLPRNTMGKVQKNILREEYKSLFL